MRKSPCAVAAKFCGKDASCRSRVTERDGPKPLASRATTDMPFLPDASVSTSDELTFAGVTGSAKSGSRPEASSAKVAGDVTAIRLSGMVAPSSKGKATERRGRRMVVAALFRTLLVSPLGRACGSARRVAADPTRTCHADTFAIPPDRYRCHFQRHVEADTLTHGYSPFRCMGPAASREPAPSSTREQPLSSTAEGRRVPRCRVPGPRPRPRFAG